MALLEWYNKGLTIDEYVSSMKVNKDEMNKIYTKFLLNRAEKEQIQAVKSKGLKVIVITEDWCGDAMLNNPILLKLAEEAEMDVRFILRDSNLELMDQYLTNGTSRSIPIFIFIDQNGVEKAVWGPRAEKLQELVMSEVNKLPHKESDDFKDKQMEMYKRLRERYQREDELWHIVAGSILKVLAKVE